MDTSRQTGHRLLKMGLRVSSHQPSQSAQTGLQVSDHLPVEYKFRVSKILQGSCGFSSLFLLLLKHFFIMLFDIRQVKKYGKQ